MSADQSIIDLTNETQEDMLNDDIEIVSQKLRNRHECNSNHNKKRRLNDSPDILEIEGSTIPSRPKQRRRNNVPTLSSNHHDFVTVSEEIIEEPSNSSNVQNTLPLPQSSPPIPSPPVIAPGFECPICLEKHKDNLVVTNCGHIFCKPCLKESLKASKQCAKCRKKLTAKSYHSIFI